MGEGSIEFRDKSFYRGIFCNGKRAALGLAQSSDG